jgi:outer membrane lipoprotein SlyB
MSAARLVSRFVPFALLASASIAFAQAPAAPPAPAAAVAAAAASAVKGLPAKLAVAPMCDTCGTVIELRDEKRKGKGGAVGLVGGAVAGGVLGNQVGGGDGNKVATVAGAVGGAVIGNEIQKRLNRKTVYISKVRMKNGVEHIYETEAAPAWKVGDTVRLDGQTFVKI